MDQKAFVLFLNGRPTFVGYKDPYPKDLALLLYGASVSPGYEVWQWAKEETARPSKALSFFPSAPTII